MKQCTKCEKHLPDSHFGSKSYTNRDGSKTFTKKSRCRQCTNTDNLERYHTRTSTQEAHKRAAYKYQLKTYGLSTEEYEQMVVAQDNKCYICEETTTTRLCVDHCHSTGKLRKLLCSQCNTGLGAAKESVERLAAMIKYVEEHSSI